MVNRRCPGNEENVGSALKQPGQSELHWRRLQRCCRCIKPCRLQWREASKWEVGHVSNALRGQFVDESVVPTLGYVVKVLNADNLCDRPGFGQLAGRDRTKADMVNEALLLELGERRERLFERLVFRSGGSAELEIYNLERIETQVAQIVVNGANDLMSRACVNPGTVGAAARTDFGHNHEIIWVRMQRLFDELIGDMRSVEIAGIDVVH